MSKYTTEVRFICEFEAGYDESQGYQSVDEIVTKAAPKIFDFDFPIFDADYRLPLEKRILKHYYTREISEETYGLWKLRLEDKLNLIMPYYNKLYQSELLKYDPLKDVDVTRSHEGEDKGTTSQADNTTSNRTITNGNTRWDLYSDTPQGGINGITGDEDSVANNTYLTDARKITDQGGGSVGDVINGTKSGTNKLEREFEERIVGKQGTQSYSRLVEEYRKTFRKIDEEIIKELSPLFFGLWN